MLLETEIVKSFDDSNLLNHEKCFQRKHWRKSMQNPLIKVNLSNMCDWRQQQNHVTKKEIWHKSTEMNLWTNCEIGLSLAFIVCQYGRTPKEQFSRNHGLLHQHPQQ